MTDTLGPTEARVILQLAAIPVLGLEHDLTHRVIAAIPPNRADFRPQPAARTAGELARHIVNTELRFLAGVVAGTFSPWRDFVDAAADLDSVLDLYDTESAATMRELAALPGDDLIRELDYRGVVKMPALGFVQLAMNHTIHHRDSFPCTCGCLESASLLSMDERPARLPHPGFRNRALG